MLLRSEQVAENARRLTYEVSEAAVKSGRSADAVRLMAVTKTVPPELVNTAIENGINLLGENRVQEFLDKREQYCLSNGAIHFIGHLQTNKLKYIIDKVDMIESVHSVKLAEMISTQAQKLGVVMPVLLEVNISGEESKSGFSPAEILESCQHVFELPNVQPRGIMCIPERGRGDYYFARSQELFEEICSRAEIPPHFDQLSMGMSGDYLAAIAFGSTEVRLGSALFGKRETITVN